MYRVESSLYTYFGAAYHSQVGIHSNYKICIYALRACAHNGRHYFEIYKYIKRKAYRADRQAICNILSVLLRRPLTKRFSQNNSAESTTPHGTVVKFVYNEEIIFFLYFYIYLCICIFKSFSLAQWKIIFRIQTWENGKRIRIFVPFIYAWSVVVYTFIYIHKWKWEMRYVNGKCERKIQYI